MTTWRFAKFGTSREVEFCLDELYRSPNFVRHVTSRDYSRLISG